MTSPYANRDRSTWTDELLGQIDDLQENGVDLAQEQDVSVEFAGSPDQRRSLVEYVETQGWTSMRGIGVEPEATVLIHKSGAWTEDQLIEVQAAMLDAATQFECVFEGLCYHSEART